MKKRMDPKVYAATTSAADARILNPAARVALAASLRTAPIERVRSHLRTVEDEKAKTKAGADRRYLDSIIAVIRDELSTRTNTPTKED